MSKLSYLVPTIGNAHNKNLIPEIYYFVLSDVTQMWEKKKSMTENIGLVWISKFCKKNIKASFLRDETVVIFHESVKIKEKNLKK